MLISFLVKFEPIMVIVALDADTLYETPLVLNVITSGVTADYCCIMGKKNPSMTFPCCPFSMKMQLSALSVLSNNPNTPPYKLT